MKILQVISSFPPAFAYGGPARVAYDISKELVKRGHEVTVYTTDVLDKTSRHKFESNPTWLDGIEVYHYRNISNYFAANCGITCAPKMSLALRNNLKKFDIVHCHENRSFEAALLHHYAKKYKVPYILQAHGSVLPLFHKQKLKNVFDYFVGFDLLNDASKLIALTEIEAEQYHKMGVTENKIEVLPNGIDLVRYENLPEKGVFRKKYGIKNNQKVLLYLGRIHKIKGINLLVEAFSELTSRMEDIKLVIAGPDNGFLSILEAQIGDLNIKDKVLFTGPLYEKDKLEAYVDADVYVLPSVYEAFPVTVLEACACGTPVIVTKNCAISNIVDNKVGYVSDFEKGQLCETIFKLLNNYEDRVNFSENGRKIIFEFFDWSNIQLKLERIYSQCIHPSPFK